MAGGETLIWATPWGSFADAMDTASIDPRSLTENRGQSVLTFMYMCVLGLCFMTAVVYFCRMQWEERYLRRLRENELIAMRSALSQSEATQREESLAVQRKYIEERRARILQLFEPVKMVSISGSNQFQGLLWQSLTISAWMLWYRQTLEPAHFSLDEETKKAEQELAKREEVIMNMPAPEENAYGDEDSLLIEIPTPGLHLTLAPNEKPATRLVSGMCTICLCTFDVGAEIIWSSNELCEHVFHKNCIEKWLMKQREGPLCPCCRRDFIVDPYDIETGDRHNAETPSSSRIQSIFSRGMTSEEQEA